MTVSWVMSWKLRILRRTLLKYTQFRLKQRSLPESILWTFQSLILEAGETELAQDALRPLGSVMIFLQPAGKHHDNDPSPRYCIVVRFQAHNLQAKPQPTQKLCFRIYLNIAGRVIDFFLYDQSSVKPELQEGISDLRHSKFSFASGWESIWLSKQIKSSLLWNEIKLLLTNVFLVERGITAMCQHL